MVVPFKVETNAPYLFGRICVLLSAAELIPLSQSVQLVLASAVGSHTNKLFARLRFVVF